jgi:hypothetical protein
MLFHAFNCSTRGMPPRRPVPTRPPVPLGRASASGRAVPPHPPRRVARAAPALPAVPVVHDAPLVRKRKRMFCSSCHIVDSIGCLLLARSCCLSVFFFLYP